MQYAFIFQNNILNDVCIELLPLLKNVLSCPAIYFKSVL